MITQQCFLRAIWIEQFNFFISSLTFRDIITLKARKKMLELASFYYASREIWLGNSKMLVCIDHAFFRNHENSKMFNITSKYFNFFFNKKPFTRWVAHKINYLCKKNQIKYSTKYSRSVLLHYSNNRSHSPIISHKYFEKHHSIFLFL